MTDIKRLFAYGLSAYMAFSLVACDSDDKEDTSEPTPEITESQPTFFISANGESAEYVLTTDDINSGDLSLAGQGIELEQTNYRWIFNHEPSVAIGLVYAQGEPGIGLGYQLDAYGNMQSIGSFQITSRFTSYGFFESNAITSVGGQTLTDDQGNALLDNDGNERSDGATFNIINFENGQLSMSSKSIETLDKIVDGQQVTFSGIVDMGNGEFLTGVVASTPKATAEGGGSSGSVLYPDSCWVAALDADLNIKRVYRSDKLSYASGRYRSQYYSQINQDDKGNAYVFSGSFETTATKPCGALRINSGATDFDDSYYFNIEALSDGYHFRQVWHITEDYFLLEFYNELEVTTNTPATQYGIVKMEDKTFNWLSGFLSKDSITDSGLPMSYEGKLYFPITVDGEYPAIYVIDPATATAEKGITVEATAVNAIGIMETE
ncbi:DUF4374 domain-containing protein [Limibacter armeniacum]|uniref:DUF4374 domain-containing protein n=1 Tax=Limibacter armeniacum TaxID=466084 RepID=UPI002FE68475